MFSRLATVAALFTLAVYVAAAPNASGTTAAPTTTLAVTAPVSTATEPASQCDTSSLQCCDSTSTAGAPAAAGVLALLGVVVQDLNIPVGLTCDPISAVGVGGDSCSASPVCCEDNSFNGLIALGCVPVDLGL